MLVDHPVLKGFGCYFGDVDPAAVVLDFVIIWPFACSALIISVPVRVAEERRFRAIRSMVQTVADVCISGSVTMIITSISTLSPKCLKSIFIEVFGVIADHFETEKTVSIGTIRTLMTDSWSSLIWRSIRSSRSGVRLYLLVFHRVGVLREHRVCNDQLADVHQTVDFRQIHGQIRVYRLLASLFSAVRASLGVAGLGYGVGCLDRALGCNQTEISSGDRVTGIVEKPNPRNRGWLSPPDGLATDRRKVNLFERELCSCGSVHDRRTSRSIHPSPAAVPSPPNPGRGRTLLHHRGKTAEILIAAGR